jgi:hypothetical protein
VSEKHSAIASICRDGPGLYSCAILPAGRGNEFIYLGCVEASDFSESLSMLLAEYPKKKLDLQFVLPVTEYELVVMTSEEAKQAKGAAWWRKMAEKKIGRILKGKAWIKPLYFVHSDQVAIVVVEAETYAFYRKLAASLKVGTFGVQIYDLAILGNCNHMLDRLAHLMWLDFSEQGCRVLLLSPEGLVSVTQLSLSPESMEDKDQLGFFGQKLTALSDSYTGLAGSPIECVVVNASRKLDVQGWFAEGVKVLPFEVHHEGLQFKSSEQVHLAASIGGVSYHVG